MDTRIIDEELANYGSFVKTDILKKSDSDVELDSLQPPEESVSEEELLALGDFVPPQIVQEESPEAEGFEVTEASETSEVSYDSYEGYEADDEEPHSAAPAGLISPQTSDSSSEAPLTRVKRPIGVKLILIISLLVLFSMGIITILVSYFISKDTSINAEDNNLTINSRTASDCQSRLNSVISSAGILYDVLISDSEEESLERVVNSFFERNKYIAAVSFKDLDSISYNRPFFTSNEIEQSLFEAYVMQETEAVAASRQGSVKLLNASPFFGVQTIAIFTPVYSSTQSDSAVILFACDELSESFANSSINSSTLVNDEGIVLIDPDIQQILSAADISKNQLIETMLNSKNNNEQFVYKD